MTGCAEGALKNDDSGIKVLEQSVVARRLVELLTDKADDPRRASAVSRLDFRVHQISRNALASGSNRGLAPSG